MVVTGNSRVKKQGCLSTYLRRVRGMLPPKILILWVREKWSEAIFNNIISTIYFHSAWMSVCEWSALTTSILHVQCALATGVLVTHAYTALSRIASCEIKSLGKISMCMVYNTHTLAQTGQFASRHITVQMVIKSCEEHDIRNLAGPPKPPLKLLVTVVKSLEG